MRHEAFIFDLDGTVYLGDSPLPGAVETLATLRERGARTLYVSNNPTRRRAQYIDKLRNMGIEVEEADVISSSMAMVELLRAQAPSARLLVIGEQPLCDELAVAGFELADGASGADIVIASFDRTFDYAKLQAAFDAIRGGARLMATNADAYCPVPGGGQPDAAAIIAAIEACTGCTLEAVAGKPSAHMAAVAVAAAGVAASACVMVGDRLETDIAMGHAAGMSTALVLTGATTREGLGASSQKPTYVIQSLSELLSLPAS